MTTGSIIMAERLLTSTVQTPLKRLAAGFLVLSMMAASACGGGGDEPVIGEENSSDTQVPIPLVEDDTTTDDTTANTDEDDSGDTFSPALPIVTSDNSFRSTHFSGSGNCAQCHNGLTDAAGNDVSIEADWSTSMMANATRDPFWRAKVASEIHRNPDLKPVIEEKCTRCHAPMANVEADYEGSITGIFEEGFLNPQNPYYDHAMDGVSCTACHQIADDGNLGTADGFSGEYSIVNPGAAERTAFGQYTDPATEPMLTNTGFRPTPAEHISDSAMCATCHNLKTPFVDEDGNLMSNTPDTEFPEQMVYSEWENSAFADSATARSCQDCHMPRTDGVKISTRPMNLAPRDAFSRHSLVGANTTMLDILATNRAALGVSANGFDTAIARSRAMLESAADIEVVNQARLNDELYVQLRINNRSGHKLPTSFPSRRAYIHFTVTDGNGTVLFESGRTNPDGSIQGVDADSDLSRYEPHYDEITRPDQVQVFEAIMQDTDDHPTYTLLRAASYIKDNRIPPAGFDKHSVADDIRVAGTALDDDNFNSGSDLVTYRIPVVATGAVTFTAELKYQSLAYGFIRDLLRDRDMPEVARFEALYDGARIRAETISAISRTVP